MQRGILTGAAGAPMRGSRIIQEIEAAAPEHAVARVKALLKPIREALDAQVVVQ